MLCRADLANLVNEAALLAGRQRKVVVDKIDFIQAVERSIAVSLLVYLCVCWREGGRDCSFFGVLTFQSCSSCFSYFFFLS
jgi:hypothetical protein